MGVLSPLGTTPDTVRSLAKRRPAWAGCASACWTTPSPAPTCARPGQGDRATLGHPGKFTYCLAGGPGKHSSLVPTFGATRSVTVAIEE